jgi:lipopolysaccharide/colanic/teichoic acid biosynthesis glycosyltransferase
LTAPSETVTAAAGAIGADTAVRRLVDVMVALALLALLSPVLMLVAMIVRLDSPGSVLYRATRLGRGGEQFAMLKFRTMSVDADRCGPGVSGPRDHRVTRVGRLLRATKLDELPQLLNVVVGTMTLIGPRAEAPRYFAFYTSDERRRLLSVRPGMTGPGQIAFALRQAADLDGVEDPDRYYVEHQLHTKLAIDVAYLDDRRIGRDARVLLDTVRLMARSVRARSD